MKIITTAGVMFVFFSPIYFFQYVKGRALLYELNIICAESHDASRKALLAATNADAYVPSLVLGMPIKYCPRVNHLMHPSTDKISPIQSARVSQ